MPNRTHRKPSGILQDAGEVEVVSPHQGAVRHRHAMVVSFASEADLRRALDLHLCAYRHGQDIQERINNG